MVNKPKSIGTAAESAVKRYAREHGFPWCERQVLHGANDVGDLFLDPVGRAIVEVKGGHAAEQASDAQVALWMDEVAVEVENANAEIGFLVRKRKGHGLANPAGWWATFTLDDLVALRVSPRVPRPAEDAFVTMSLASALVQLRWGGYGTPINTGVDAAGVSL